MVDMLVLIKFMVQTLPNFLMQTYMLSRALTKNGVSCVEISFGESLKLQIIISILKLEVRYVH